jgi:hypothetical protein
MSSNKWFSLNDSNKAIWDSLDDQAKAIILGYVPPTNTIISLRQPLTKPPFMPPLTGKSGFAKSSPVTQTNFLEISAYDFLLANMHALESSDDIEVDANDEPVDPLPEDDLPDTRLINAAKSKVSPILPGLDVLCHIKIIHASCQSCSNSMTRLLP